MPIPVVSCAEMRQWEKATWAAGRTEVEVICRVGHVVTQRVRQLTRPGDFVLVVAGKGHNGDDARHTSQNLNDRELYLVNVQDAPAALEELRSQLSLGPALIVDGLFGIGLNRKLDEDWIALIEAMNTSGSPILSIDVPSGLNADTGEPEGRAVRAAVTLTLGAPKRGLLHPRAYPYVGRLDAAPDIGLVPCPIDGPVQWTLKEDFAGFPPARPVGGHKGTFGHVAILAGSQGYHGAAVLAARGAVRARPGLVTVFTSEEAYPAVAAQLAMPMVHPWRRDLELPEGTTALVCGPGLASKSLPQAWREQIAEYWRDWPGAMVVDASALPWLPPSDGEGRGPRVMTPHPGEAGRLLGCGSDEVQEDRVGAVRRLSRRYGGCAVVLKGHQTVVGMAEGSVFLNSSGNPGLAQGGSGDVLSGYLGGLLARREVQREMLVKTLRYGVWQHGAVADQLSLKQRNWTLDELLGQLGNVEVC